MRRISLIPALVLFCSSVALAQNDPMPAPGPDLNGERWQGTLHNEISSTFRAGASGSCTGEAWDYNLSLVVVHDGTVDGKAVGHLVSPPQCSFAVSGTQAKNKSADVSGKFDGRQFELQFNMTSADGMTLGVDSLVGRPGLAAPKILVPITGPGIAQADTATTRTNATVTGSGRQTVKLKRDCDPLTPEAVTQAILKALKEHHITLPSFWHGEAPGRFVHNLQPKGYYPNGPEPYSLLPNEVGFLVLPEQHSDILIIGTAKAPCKGSSDGSIIVDLMIWETRVVDGKRFPYGMIEEVTGSGDDSQKGLDDAMRKAFDSAKLDQYKSSGPPS